jgi:hypothetical protein
MATRLRNRLNDESKGTQDRAEQAQTTTVTHTNNQRGPQTTTVTHNQRGLETNNVDKQRGRSKTAPYIFLTLYTNHPKSRHSLFSDAVDKPPQDDMTTATVHDETAPAYFETAPAYFEAAPAPAPETAPAPADETAPAPGETATAPDETAPAPAETAPADVMTAAATPVKEVAGQVSINVLKGWPREKLLEFALWHMHAAEKRREFDRKYSVSARGRERQRRYYFASRDIYRPQLNPAGAQEKRWKRPQNNKRPQDNNKRPQEAHEN